MTTPDNELTATAHAFCQRHNLTSAELLRPDFPVIHLMNSGLEAFDQELGLASRDGVIPVEEPAWALIRAMVFRGFAHADAGFVCLASGSLATVEVVARATLESCLNVLYLLEEDRVGRLYDYMAHYVKEERSELGRWEGLLTSMTPSEVVVHRQEIANKREAIDHQDAITAEFAAGAGIARPPRAWPKVAERFRALGHEVDYRLLYAAMCSQAHNDAEDLFNTLLVGAIAHHCPGHVARDYEFRQQGVNAFFARLLTYRSVEYLFQCLTRYGESYGVQTITDLGTRAVHRTRDLTAELCHCERDEVEQFGRRVGRLPFGE